MKDVNVTIVNWRMKEDTDKCLASLFKDAAESRVDISVHVIDNSENRDGIQEMLEEKYPQVKYYNPGKNLGFGRAQNVGLKMTEAKFYLPLNPDIEFLPNYKTLRKLINYLNSHEKVGIVAPKLISPDGSTQESCRRFPGIWDQIPRRINLDKKFKFFQKKVDYYLMKDFEYNKTVAVDWAIGGFLLIKREVVEKIGFFDDRFFVYFEDCDFCRRTWLANWEIHYIHDAKLKHLHRQESAMNSLPWLAPFRNSVTRMHISSWWKYFWKWRFKNVHFGY